MQTANNTKGHSAVNPGLRGHSCGDNYPLTVIGVGSKWCVLNCRSGSESELRLTYKEAEIDMYSLRVRNLMHS